MKSSDKQIEGGLLSNGPLYSLLALYIPVTVLAAFVFLIKAMTAANLPSFFLIACGCASGLAASFYCDFMKDTKSSRTAANIRGGIITAVICYICASLLRREVIFRERFLPDSKNILSCAASLYVWFYVVSLKRLFSARMNFETYTKLYQGEKLQSVLFEDSALLQYYGRKYRQSAVALFFTACLNCASRAYLLIFKNSSSLITVFPACLHPHRRGMFIRFF